MGNFRYNNVDMEYFLYDSKAEWLIETLQDSFLIQHNSEHTRGNNILVLSTWLWRQVGFVLFILW